MLILAVFLLALAVGVLSTGFWVRESELGRGYSQTNILVVLGLLGIVGALVATGVVDPWPGHGAEPWLLYLGLAFSLLGYAATWAERWPVARLASGAALAVLIAALWTVAFPHRFALDTPVLSDVSLLLSALLLGWSLVTMLLGHWYLVAPKLDFRYLQRFCWVLVLLILLRIGLSTAAMWSASNATPDHAWRALTSFGGWAMFLWIRVLWGLVGALLLAGMSLHCARRGSNQSATGILYVVVVSVWIGEGAALFLRAMSGVPV